MTSTANKPLVSMKRLLLTGEFGPVCLRASRQDVRAHFGEPEQTGGTSRKQRVTSIWKYGNIEFYFSRADDRLWYIQADDFEDDQVLQGGSGFELDAWVLRGGASWDGVKAALFDEGIPFQPSDWSFEDDTLRFLVGAGVELIFGGKATTPALRAVSFVER